MLRRLLLPAVCTAALVLVSVLLPGAGRPRTAPHWTNRAAARFWTPERMADSMPSSVRQLGPAAEPGTVPGPFTRSETATHFGGVPTVGMLFSVDGDMTAHFCTASVVHSPDRDLILTAAHCRPGANIGFVPQFRAGAARQPYGIWAVSQVFTDARWAPADDAESAYDFAFARVAPDADGRRIEEVTGGNRLIRTPGFHNRVTVIGYPRTSDDPSDEAITCTTTTSRLEGLRQLQLVCAGYFAGTSGSPWLLDYNTRTKSGSVIGLIGGEDEGGLSDRISYSPFFDDAIQALYRKAVRTRSQTPHMVTAKR
ncbi:trypsin-like peptidase domain-containing protein [Streptomyces sp. NPDC008139]|uniref:trypsin-like serine peptidase n=1 Tax=Streptomyces sp. NPDC008139 TaxID=3364814 RepID=UPI0036E243C3